MPTRAARHRVRDLAVATRGIEQRIDDGRVDGFEIRFRFVPRVERGHRHAGGQQVDRGGMAFGARVAHCDAFEGRTGRGKHHVGTGRTETDDNDAPGHQVVGVAFLESRTAGTFGASTRYVFGFQVPYSGST